MSKFFVLGTKLAQANDNVVGATQCVAHGAKYAVLSFIAGYKAQRQAIASGKAVVYPHLSGAAFPGTFPIAK